MLDIRHEKVDPQALKKAVRVSFSKYKCKCQQYCAPPYRFWNFCWETIGRAGDLDILIMDMRKEEYYIYDVIRILSKLQQVKTFIAPKCTFGRDFSRLLNALPNIRHVYGKGFRGTLGYGNGAVFGSQTLTTLSFRIRKDGEYETVQWNLPALRHLRVKGDDDASRDVKAAILALLSAVGNRLLSLHLLLKTDQKETLWAVWDLCPRLKILRAGVPMDSPPPFFHPLHTLIVPDISHLEGFMLSPEWPNLRRIVIDRDCGQIQEGRVFTTIEGRPDVRVEDRRGLAVDGFVSCEA